MIQIAFYRAKYGTWADKSIGALTRSEYSHCEIVFNRTIFATSSQRDGGVRLKHINPSIHWDIFDFKVPVNVKYENKIFDWFKSIEGQKYDYYGAAGSVIGVNLCSPNRKFCSFCCAFVLDLNPIVTPGKLYDELVKKEIIYSRFA